jgi:hypothetical protein
MSRFQAIAQGGKAAGHRREASIPSYSDALRRHHTNQAESIEKALALHGWEVIYIDGHYSDVKRKGV